MKLKTTLLNLTALLLIASTALLHSASYEWSNFAGMPGGAGSVNGTGTAARFNRPAGVAVDSAGNLFVADRSNHVIRKISKTGVVTTFAGQTGAWGHADGTGSAARFNEPSGLVMGSGGVLYVTELQNQVIRKVTSAGVVTTLAGKAGVAGPTDGTGEAARFYRPAGMALAADGSLLVADSGSHTLRKVTMAGVVTTLAGLAGVNGTADGSLANARFRYPEGIARAADGTLYITDSGNCTIRKITPAGVVSTLAGKAGTYGAVDGTGTMAEFDYPTSLIVRPNGVLWVADYYNGAIRQVTQAGEVTTVMGVMGQWFNVDGVGTAARLSGPHCMTADAAGTIYITDVGNHNVRKATAVLMVTTVAGQAENRGSTDGTGTVARFNFPEGISVDAADELIIADTYNRRVRKATQAAAVSTIAGTGAYGSTDGPAAMATFGGLYDSAVDSTGAIYLADSQHTIRKMDMNGEVSTFAGTAGSPGSADGTGADARFNYIQGLDVGKDDTIYVADTWNRIIRKITSSGEVTTLAGSAGLAGHVDGTGSAARFNSPSDLAVDDEGVVYVVDSQDQTIRKITPEGVVTTLAGSPNHLGNTDGTGAAARFQYPAGIALDPYGNLIVCDSGNHTLRRVTPAGVVTTIGGMPGQAGATDGPDAAARFSQPFKVATDSTGAIYFVDKSNNRVVKGVPHPEIAVEEPVGTSLVDGTAVGDFGAVSIHENVVKTYTITNLGGASLTGLSMNVTGAHAADFMATSLSKPTLLPGQSMTFTVTFSGDVSGTRTAALSITSNDADEASFDISLKAEAADRPVVITAPASQVAQEGDTVTFTAQASHPTATVKYQWLKNAAKINGATTNALVKSALKLADGGTYTLEMTSNGAITRRTATLVVARHVEQTHVIKAGSLLKLSVSASGPATFAWTKDNQPFPGTAATLSLAAANFGWSGTYRCHVSGPGGDTLVAAVFTVLVFDFKPQVISPQNLPDGAVGWPYSHQIKINTQNRYAPSSYSASKLPPGVKLDTKSGLISGFPTVAGDYEIIVTATNSLGSHGSTKETVTITPLGDTLKGSFSGIVARNDLLNAGLGGRVDLTIASTAAISGSLTLGTKSHPFKGQLNASTSPQQAIISVTRAGQSSVTLTLLFDVATQSFAAGSRVKLGLFQAAVSGWRLKWEKTGTTATLSPKLFTFGLRPTLMKGSPAGDGFGSFTLNPDGKITLAGKTPDGEGFTCATFVGPHGQIGVFKTLLTPTGSLLGVLDIDPADTGTLSADTLEGTVTWQRPANAKSRVYPAGFNALNLTAFGGRYTVPAAPALILGMALGDKALITFSDAGLGDASINPDVPAFDILAGNTPSLPPALSAGNPGSVKITKLDAKTGLFTGTFVLNDTELRASQAGQMLKRTGEFSGILTQDSMGPVGVGHFLLPEMPVDAAPPLPATTPTTSAKLSGSVILEKKM
ncbi:choice-of-anchor D domain-containing protein [Brevifollis gellanilyticus]|uniref:Ig-like domain-containing protein n=1 Tax=Brevifollis gellanilyticus TaxID=748831 RepID=A0A512MH74_9BACT|nr:choice-of-anchor D domain-containing protein [Brevifollis gellanilyticus]GEP46085.1 hypothetical protein BGE01nite_53760 [Brevifollis gellanilyticus]